MDLDTLTPEDILEVRQVRRNIRVSDPVKAYIADIVRATREHTAVEYGASPRGSLGLLRAGQARALIRERDFVLPDDIKALTCPVLSHRLILKEKDRLRGVDQDRILKEIMQKVPVPTDAG